MEFWKLVCLEVVGWYMVGLGRGQGVQVCFRDRELLGDGEYIEPLHSLDKGWGEFSDTFWTASRGSTTSGPTTDILETGTKFADSSITEEDVCGTYSAKEFELMLV